MQPDELTEEVFTGQLNTKFYIPLAEKRVELELFKVTGDKSSMDKIEGVERFALYFQGPGDLYLPQSTYRMEHDALGELDIFIVPVSQKNNQFQYEAVFSHMTDKG